MTHYPVLVCLRDPDMLATALRPFDENVPVDPYPIYETGPAGQSWRLALLRDKTGWAPDEANLSWAQLADRWNTHIASDVERLCVDPDGRAYVLSTYNPASGWDWWQIGARWSGSLRLRPEAVDDPRIIRPATTAAEDPLDRLYCDGAPRGLLDFTAARAAAADRARADHATYRTLVAGLPDAQPWAVFRTRARDEPGYSLDQARADYHAQPAVAALDRAGGLGVCPIEHFAGGLDAYIARQRQGAVPGYALLTVDGRWLAPGRMGWWGLSDDTADTRQAYLAEANTYLDALDPDVYLICVDCHI